MFGGAGPGQAAGTVWRPKSIQFVKGPPSPQKIPIFAKNEIKDSIGLIYAYYGAAQAIGLAD